MNGLLANAESESRFLYDILSGSLLFGGLVVAILLAIHHRRNPPDKQALTEAIAARSWSTCQVVFLFVTLCLLYIGAMFSGCLFYEDQIPLARLVITLIIYSIIMVIIAVINRRRGIQWGTANGKGLGNTRKLLLAPVLYLAAMPFLMLTSKAYHLLLQYVFGVEPEIQEVARIVIQETSWVEILYTLVAILIAPIYEELIFRGIVFTYLVKRIGLAGGTVLASVLFSMMHFHLPSFVPLYMLSVALCMAYWRTGSLWASIGMHILFNAVTILALNIVG